MLLETYYHIYTHANGNENLFRSDDNYLFFLKRYAHFIHRVADTFAYCLMPNRIHFLIRIHSEAELVPTFGKFKTFQKLEPIHNYSFDYKNFPREGQAWKARNGA